MRRQLPIWAFLVVGFLPARAQEVNLPDNPLDGRILFETRGCISCHAISGYGGDLGPDLARDQYYGSFLGLAADIWNHIPDMNRQYRLRGIPRPVFTEKEMLDLAGFIYYLRYLGEPGSVSRGRQLLTDRKCTTCHGRDGTVPALDDLDYGGSPIQMVQAMWNHGPAMQDAIGKKGLRFPDLSGHDISDISAYLQMAASHGPTVRTAPGNPARGKALFVSKNCVNCHSQSSPDRESAGPPLREMDLEKSVVEIAGLMWNHGPVMRDYMAGENIEWPRFEGSEMADVIAYLYFLAFTNDDGDASAGEVVFRSKGCADCHQSGTNGLGPDLAKIRRLDRPGRLAQLMWNHAEDMEDLLLARNEAWPRLTETDLQNLLAYLKQLTLSE